MEPDVHRVPLEGRTREEVVAELEAQAGRPIVTDTALVKTMMGAARRQPFQASKSLDWKSGDRARGHRRQQRKQQRRSRRSNR